MQVGLKSSSMSYNKEKAQYLPNRKKVLDGRKGCKVKEKGCEPKRTVQVPGKEKQIHY